MSGQIELLLTVAVVHLLGLGCVVVLLIGAFRGDDPPPPWQSDSGSDDGWGNEPRNPRRPSDVPWGGLPLPDAEPSRIRLRDHERLGDRLPRRQRRPSREPDRTPVRAGSDRSRPH
jgi:hypothetical protein